MSTLLGKIQNMDPWSTDPLCRPGLWTESIKIWTCGLHKAQEHCDMGAKGKHEAQQKKQEDEESKGQQAKD